MKHLETYQERRLRFACHYGDVRQLGAPPACGAGVSRFDPDTSHRSHYLQDVPRELD